MTFNPREVAAGHYSGPPSGMGQGPALHGRRPRLKSAPPAIDTCDRALRAQSNSALGRAGNGRFVGEPDDVTTPPLARSSRFSAAVLPSSRPPRPGGERGGHGGKPQCRPRSQPGSGGPELGWFSRLCGCAAAKHGGGGSEKSETPLRVNPEQAPVWFYIRSFFHTQPNNFAEIDRVFFADGPWFFSGGNRGIFSRKVLRCNVFPCDASLITEQRKSAGADG